MIAKVHRRTRAAARSPQGAPVPAARGGIRKVACDETHTSKRTSRDSGIPERPAAATRSESSNHPVDGYTNDCGDANASRNRVDLE